jgi:hypothetical protein
MIALRRELLADLAYVGLIRMTLGDLAVGVSEGCATGLQQTQV